MKGTIFIFLVSILTACQLHRTPKPTSGSDMVDGLGSSVRYTLKAINLTEDVSRVSSGNDEVLLLIYATSEGLIPLQTLEKQLLTFDKTHRVFTNQVSVPADSSTAITVVMIEVDSERRLEELRQVVSRQLPAIAQAYQAGQRQQLRKYLNDEDLLGLEVIPARAFRTNSSRTLVFKGFHLFDEYEYELLIQSGK